MQFFGFLCKIHRFFPQTQAANKWFDTSLQYLSFDTGTNFLRFTIHDAVLKKFDHWPFRELEFHNDVFRISEWFLNRDYGALIIAGYS